MALYQYAPLRIEAIAVSRSLYYFVFNDYQCFAALTLTAIKVCFLLSLVSNVFCLDLVWVLSFSMRHYLG